MYEIKKIYCSGTSDLGISWDSSFISKKLPKLRCFVPTPRTEQSENLGWEKPSLEKRSWIGFFVRPEV